MALTAIGLCARALIKLGAAPISSFEEGSAEAETAAALYETTRDALLAAHPWSFAIVEVALPRLSEDPVGDKAFAFQLPSDFIRAVSAGAGGRTTGLEYLIIGRTLTADAESVTLTHIRRPNEADFPAFFDQALIARLAVEFCLPLTESASRWQLLARAAEDELKAARRIDAAQDAQPRFEDFSLIEARLG